MYPAAKVWFGSCDSAVFFHEVNCFLAALDVTDDFNIIGTDGRPHPHICAIGIPVEGKFWFNAADARPDVNSNAIAQLSKWVENALSRLKSKEEAES